MRFLTAGESHGPGLTVIVDDFPAGVRISLDALNRDLTRRQQGYGRSPRQKTEHDTAVINGGVRFGKTTGAPIAMWVVNREHANWTEVIRPDGEVTEAAENKRFTRPRPGHADLAGAWKYDLDDLRDVLERASARETAARVAAGGIAKALLEPLGIRIFSHVVTLGGVTVSEEELTDDYDAIWERSETNDLRCAGNADTLKRMTETVDQALAAGNTLGGDIEVVALGVPPGLGSYVQWDRKLDGILAQALMSIQAVKAVSIGAGDLGGRLPGKDFHDEILWSEAGGERLLHRPSNRAGGLEGGVTNGKPLVLKAVMKPISTMRAPLRSIDLATGEVEAAHFERSDTTAVPACGVVCEAMMAVVLAQAVLDKFGHDNFGDIQNAYNAYLARLKPKPEPARS